VSGAVEVYSKGKIGALGCAAVSSSITVEKIIGRIVARISTSRLSVIGGWTYGVVSPIELFVSFPDSVNPTTIYSSINN
jgi:hypothetical protein